MKIVPVPCRSDNYMYLLIDESTKTAAVVDPYDPKKLVAVAEKEGVKLGKQLITTHHHHDHAHGNNEFANMFPGITVYGGSDQVQGLTQKIKQGDSFKIGNSITITGLATPCHTQDSICFFAEDNAANQKAVFTGDTLFVSGCGRFFEGEPQEMHTALNKTLASLPDSTRVYCGHEYTKANVAFSSSVDPTNSAIQELKKFADANEITTGSFTIGDEKKHNVFMRLSSDAVKEATGEVDPIKAMGKLREMKNSFKG